MMDSATMVRMARQRAGMTQAELAERAGTSAPTISAYEHGTRHPRADVLLRVLRAANSEAVLVPSSASRDRYVDLLCDLLADRLRRDPDLVASAMSELSSMRDSANVRAWHAVLEAGMAAVVAVLTSRDPEVRGLKADNPFARLGLVDEGTRLELVDLAHGR